MMKQAWRQRRKFKDRKFVEAMMSNEQMNDADMLAKVPTGNPQLISMLQFYLGLAQSGRIVAGGIAAVQADGVMINSSVFPSAIPTLGILANGLDMVKEDIQNVIRETMQKANQPVILRPRI
jgi:hypothetical protein